jgi:hypothetical protein
MNSMKAGTSLRINGPASIVDKPVGRRGCPRINGPAQGVWFTHQRSRFHALTVPHSYYLYVPVIKTCSYLAKSVDGGPRPPIRSAKKTGDL